MNDVAEVMDESVAEPVAEPSGGIPERPSIEKFETWEALENGYRELESYRGNSIRIPSKEAGDESWNEFNEKITKIPGVTLLPQEGDTEGWNNYYQQLGAPADPSGYILEAPEELQGMEATDFAEFQQVAHANHLTREQAQGVFQHLTQNLVEADKAAAEESMRMVDEYKRSYGANFEHALNEAKAAAITLEAELPGISEYMNSIGPDSKTFDVNTVKMLTLFAKLSGEQGLIGGGRTSMAINKEEAMLQVQEIRDNPDHPYNNELDPAHEAAKTKVANLYKMAYGG
jgi:hypothetical protein